MIMLFVHVSSTNVDSDCEAMLEFGWKITASIYCNLLANDFRDSIVGAIDLNEPSRFPTPK